MAPNEQYILDPTVEGVSGSWQPEIAERIPTGCRIIIRTDSDTSGENYAEKIRASLADRCVILRKHRETETKHA